MSVQTDLRGTELRHPENDVDAAPRTHYRMVAVVCGHAVGLHDGLDRHLAATPPATDCGQGAP